MPHVHYTHFCFLFSFFFLVLLFVVLVLVQSMCDAKGDGCVVHLNNQAKLIMEKYEIPTINLHDAVVNECGEPPQHNCFNQTGCFCPHCSSENSPGYTFLTERVIVPAIVGLLPK